MSGFIWNDIIANVAAINDTDLSGNGITIQAVQPLLAQNCKTPLMFPSRNPSINVTKVQRVTFGAASPNGNCHKGITAYTLDWIYLHIEYTQGLLPYEYEIPIRKNLAAIFRAVVRRDRTLGVGRVLPMSAEIDFNIQDPTSGKLFLGAHLVLGVDEIFEL